MKAKQFALFLLIFILLSACTFTKVEISPDNRFDALGHQQYAWSSKAIGDTGRNRFYHDFDVVLRKEVARVLSDKGYRQVAIEKADFLVAYHFVKMSSPDKGGLISPTNQSRSAWEAGEDVNNTAIQNHYVPAEVLRGYLQLNITDVASGSQVWKATASKVIENTQGEAKTIERTMKKVIPKLLKSLPAKK